MCVFAFGLESELAGVLPCGLACGLLCACTAVFE